MQGTIQSVNSISESVDGIAETIQIISGIASSTSLLTMNAATEAAHAKEAERDFAVVAGEIRKLADKTRENSRNIAATLKTITGEIEFSTKQADYGNVQRNRCFAATMSHLIAAFNDLAAENNGVISALNKQKDQNGTVKSGYAQVLPMTEKLTSVMTEYCQ